jgi:transcriptional regulator with XRE-family HTH domain
MTIRNANNPLNSADKPVMVRIGGIIKRHRKNLVDIKPPTREGFILSGYETGLPINWITEKSLANIENGLNMPSLRTIYNLSIVLQIDAPELFSEISQAFQNNSEQNEYE